MSGIFIQHLIFIYSPVGKYLKRLTLINAPNCTITKTTIATFTVIWSALLQNQCCKSFPCQFYHVKGISVANLFIFVSFIIIFYGRTLLISCFKGGSSYEMKISQEKFGKNK